MVREDAQEAASIPESTFKFGRKTASTQTHQNLDDEFDASTKTTSTGESNDHVFNQREFSKKRCPLDEPAPQWLIEEALKRGEKNIENTRPVETHDSQNDVGQKVTSHLRAEDVIVDLEKQLCTTKDELARALDEQSNIRNKYKKALKDVKIAADEQRDELQQKLVQICTSMVEKFRPNTLTDNAIKLSSKKHRKPLQHFGNLTKKIHKKLRIATLTSSQLRQEVASMKKALDEKSQQYDSLSKCWSSLKTELNNTESSMNDLLNENILLRKKIEDAREWMHTRVSKERHEKINAAQFREIQRSRELTNLKKKSEEDISAIAQLRAKLLRTESANANKGFLLNNYKAQLADLTNEKEKLSSKIKELANDNNSLRNSNTHLRANLALANSEKGKPNTELEKLETDMKNRMSIQSKLATKSERSMLQKIDTMKADYDKNIEAIKLNFAASEDAIAEYLEAIKQFLKKLYDYKQEIDAERDLSCSEASEREAHVTACEILNITPGELTGFLNGRSTDTFHSWLSDVKRITTKKCFADALGRFLFERATGDTKN